MLTFSERYKLHLNFEAFNVTNSQRDTSLNGRATAGFPDGTNARRAQVSARFSF